MNAPRRLRTGTSPRARGRGGVPSLPFQWQARGAVLAGWRCPQHAGPLDVRAAAEPTAKGPAGKWTDAATGEHGDLLDIIRESLRPASISARSPRRRGVFSSLPRSEPKSRSSTALVPQCRPDHKRPQGVCLPCRSRLRAPSLRLICSVAEYAHVHGIGSLRFHPRCYYRPDEHLPTETWPAMIACVTDLDGRITGVHRTWLDPDGFDRFGSARLRSIRHDGPWATCSATRFVSVAADDVLAAGEGIETMLSLRCVLPTMPMAAALSANHLAAILFPSTLRRLYIARDADAAGDGRCKLFCRNARKTAGIEAIPLSPRLGDFNEDLRDLRPRRPPGSVADPAGTGGRLPLSALVGHRRISAFGCHRRSTARSRGGPLPARARPRPSRGRSDGRRPGPAMAAAGYFPPRPSKGGFASRSKIAGLRHPPLRFGPALCSGCWPGPPAVW